MLRKWNLFLTGESIRHLLLTFFIYSDTEYETPLHLASYTGCIRTVKLLIQNNPTIINNENRVGETAAMFAAVNGQTKMLEVLLNNNANLWAESHGHSVEKRKTCLDWAVMNRKPETVKAILKHDNWKEVGFFFAELFTIISSIAKK